MGAALDARTGSVWWIPFTLCCWPLEVENPLNFRVDSKLIVFTGIENRRGRKVVGEAARCDGCVGSCSIGRRASKRAIERMRIGVFPWRIKRC